jgi:demethylmenaquinone methyltransferase/2-methoxy-6-polyprenyl-1,4-benzoquinol methylase
MFGRISRHYDLMNRLMTLGRDRAWRRYTVAQIKLGMPDSRTEPQPERAESNVQDQSRRIVLDVATGTGDLAFEVLRQRPDAQVVGLDFVPEMLALARQKASTSAFSTHTVGHRHSPPPSLQSPDLTAGDALKLPFSDASFDAVVTGFALRNVTDIPAAFSEMARVVRPRGRVACLEIARPQTPLFRHLFALYFYRMVPVLGEWISGQGAAYTYLPHSLTAFPSPGEIADVMRHSGWRNVSYRRLMLGTVAVHVGERA